MEKKSEVDGTYVEVEAADLIQNMDAVNQSTVLTVTNARLELAGDDRVSFLAKFNDIAEKMSDDMSGMDDAQKSFFIMRHMLLR